MPFFRAILLILFWVSSISIGMAQLQVKFGNTLITDTSTPVCSEVGTNPLFTLCASDVANCDQGSVWTFINNETSETLTFDLTDCEETILLPHGEYSVSADIDGQT